MLGGGNLFQKIRLDPSRIPIVRQVFLSIFRHFEQSEPSFLDISIIAKQNLSSGVNIVSVGAPSRMRIVLLISLGMTTLPRSSILLTIPVAFIKGVPFYINTKISNLPNWGIPCYYLLFVCNLYRAVISKIFLYKISEQKPVKSDNCVDKSTRWCYNIC